MLGYGRLGFEKAKARKLKGIRAAVFTARGEGPKAAG